MTLSGNKKIKLSVVIAAWNGIHALEECLASLEKQVTELDTEVIVVSNFQTETLENEKRFSFLKFFFHSKEAIVPELRADGILYTHGEIVALVEDHCIFDPMWCQEIKKAHEFPYGIIGGSVENASVKRVLDWAVYFYDYGKYMLPNKADVQETLSGMNVSYKREALDMVQENYKNGFFETFVNEELKRRGMKLYMMPTAIVYHNKNYELGRATTQCFHLARSFAAKRILNSALSKRAFFIVTSFVLPVLLSARIAAWTISKGRHIKELILSFPCILLLMTIWSFGEFCGYLSGEGRSARQWR